MSDLEAHPVAALFPMLTEDELADMAADIRERGLLHPIVVDGEDRILDGRNRYAACKIAGVNVDFEIYDGEDPAGYALAVNIQRRNLTKGQIAMVAARSLRVSHNGTQTSMAKSLGVHQTRISQASVVLDFAPDLADAVGAGATGLDEAHKIARDRKTAKDSVEAQLAQLREDDPELAAKVVEGELTLAGARAERAERDRKQAEEQRDARALLTRIVDLAAPQNMSDGFVGAWARHLGDADADLIYLIDRAEQAAQVLFDLSKRVRQ